MAMLQFRRATTIVVSASGAPAEWTVGDDVTVQLRGTNVVNLALLGFGLPLLGLLVGSVVGDALGGDSTAALASVVGAMLAAGIARMLFGRRSVGYVIASADHCTHDA